MDNQKDNYNLKTGENKKVKISAGKIAGLILALMALIVYSVFAYEKTGTVIPTAELIDGLPTIRFIDVGQGDCALVTYKGEAVLVDAGPGSSSESASEYIRMYSPTIDYFIITHPHEDHMGGAAEIIERTYVDKLVMSTLVSDEEFYQNTLDAAEKYGTDIVYLTDEAVFDTGNIKITVFDLFDFYSDDFNNSSLFVKIEVEDTTLLITGDAETEEEAYAVELLGDELDCDILKTGHHGSRTSTSAELLDAVTPEIAVVSCGRNNSYGHPNAEVLDRLNDYGIELYRTDYEGTVILRGEKSE